METPITTGNNGQFRPGNSGRPPGPNKLTKTVKETVLAVFNELQGDPKNDLKAFAKKHPRDFYQIAAKLIPTEVSGSIVSTIIINEQLAADCTPVEELKTLQNGIGD